MSTSTGQRVAWSAGAIVMVIVLAAMGGWLLLAHEMKARMLDALGPLGSAEKIDVGLSRITLSRVRLRAPHDWPSADALRAERIELDLDPRTLLDRRAHVRNVIIDGYQLTIVRLADGRVSMLPGLADSAHGGPPASGTAAANGTHEERLIDHVSFERGTIEFFDASLRPTYHLLITDTHARVDHIRLPTLTARTTVSMIGSIKGPSHRGTVSIDGWMAIATKHSETHATLRSVDISVFSPYLLTKVRSQTSVSGGTLGLTLDTTVRDDWIHAPGTLVIDHLQLADTGNPLDTFLSIPTKAVIAALKNRRDEVRLNFVLDGNLRDPHFSLNESLTRTVAAGFAKALGVSAAGAAKGAGETVNEIGNALMNMLHK